MILVYHPVVLTGTEKRTDLVGDGADVRDVFVAEVTSHGWGGDGVAFRATCSRVFANINGYKRVTAAVLANAAVTKDSKGPGCRIFVADVLERWRK